jgi:RHS repeat-associated protein
MENEDELVEGAKNTEYRKLDSRIGRWMSVDPAANLYYSWSPYSLSLDNPLSNTDPSGATVGHPSRWDNMKSVSDGSTIDVNKGSVLHEIDKLVVDADTEWYGSGRDIILSENPRAKDEAFNEARFGGVGYAETIFDDTWSPDDDISIRIEHFYDEN